MLFARQHSLVEDSRNQNVRTELAIKNDVASVFHPAQAGANLVAGAPECRIVGEVLATGFQIVESLQCPPSRARRERISEKWPSISVAEL